MNQMSEYAAPSINKLLFLWLTEPGYVQNQNSKKVLLCCHLAEENFILLHIFHETAVPHQT